MGSYENKQLPAIRNRMDKEGGLNVSRKLVGGQVPLCPLHGVTLNGDEGSSGIANLCPFTCRHYCEVQFDLSSCEGSVPIHTANTKMEDLHMQLGVPSCCIRRCSEAQGGKLEVPLRSLLRCQKTMSDLHMSQKAS